MKTISNNSIAGKDAVRSMALSALLAATLCVLSPLSIPLGPVPITLSVFIICLFPFVAEVKHSLFAVFLYLIIGAIGIPVFSGFEGGLAKLVGPTGGYLIGYIPMIIISGALVNASEAWYIRLIGLALGLLSCYLLGTVWLSIYLRISVYSAISKAVLPFLPFDTFKLVLALTIGPKVGARVKRITSII